MNSGGPSEDNYYNNQFMYGNENLSTAASNVMMSMGLQQNALSSLNIIVNNKTQRIGLVSNDDQNTNYYQEYCRLFIANVVLTTQMKELVAEKNELLMKLAKSEVFPYIIQN